jgi:hypothetical protein
MDRTRVIAIAAALILVACSGKDKPTEDAQPGEPQGSEVGLPDGVVLYDCDTPGQACNAHNSCAMNPVCGKDRKCRPSGFQNCDDGLPCTKDICKGLGLCENQPIADACALPVKVAATVDGGVGKTEVRCFKKGDRNPNDACLLCNPDTAAGGNPTHWALANGGTCDDKNPCTKDDYCQQGVCHGDDFSKLCADAYSCTDDVCDGKGGCLGHNLKADWCLINGECFKNGQQDQQGCNVCDVKKSQNKWTPLTVHCSIGGKCYKPGDKDATQCGVCDPTKNDKDWTPLPGLCKIEVSPLIGTACYQKGAKNTGGCAECDPAVSTTAWTVIGTDNCLINATCYKTGAKDATGCGACDPAKSKTAWTTLANQCLIASKCYATGAKDATGCGECDPAASTTTWTIKGNVCLIAGVCKQPNDPDSSGCAKCDPAKSKTAWTPVAGKCLIGGKCYADQAKDSTGCLVCDYAKKPDGWTPTAAAKAVAYTFEDGKNPPTGWTITNSDTKVGWTVTNLKPGSGSYSLYYGDPATKNYDTSGSANNGTAKLPAAAITAGKKAGLSFLLWIDTETGTSFDQLEVQVDGTKVWEKDSTNVTMKAWQEITIDLSSYAGKSITITFLFDTSDSISNSTEGLYLDNVTIFDNC